MPTIDAISATAFPPPSVLAGDRTLYELWDPSSDRTWRIVSLARGGYAVELDVDDVTLVHESHVSLDAAMARASGWRNEASPF
jgi:hypothetical protein